MIHRLSSVAIVAVLVAGCASSVTSDTPTAPPSIPAVASGTPAATLEPAPSQRAPVDLETSLDRLFGTNFNGSVLVARDGDVRYAKGFGMADAAAKIANSPETRFRIGSVTKQFTAMAILILEARGLLKSSDPVCKYVDDCPDGWGAITIEHLITHTSGIAEFTEQPDFDQMQPATPAETVASVSDIPLVRAPGASFVYNNTGYVLLGMVLEKVSGTSYEAFLQDEIFRPIGMKDSGYEHGATPGLATGYVTAFALAEPLDMSVPYAAGGLYSTVLDLHRWEEALYTERLAPAADMARYFAPIVESTERPTFAYGYGMFIGEEGGRRVAFHDGGINGFYSQLSRYPDDHITVAILTNLEASPDLLYLAQLAARAARMSR